MQIGSKLEASEEQVALLQGHPEREEFRKNTGGLTRTHKHPLKPPYFANTPRLVYLLATPAKTRDSRGNNPLFRVSALV